MNPIRAVLPVDFRNEAKRPVRDECNDTYKDDGQNGQGDSGYPHLAVRRKSVLVVVLFFARENEAAENFDSESDAVQDYCQDLAEDPVDDEAGTPDGFEDRLSEEEKEH